MEDRQRGHDPLGDASRRPRRFPVVTTAIIVVNALVFLLELMGGDEFVIQWSVIPADIVAGHHWVTILTAMFMHAGWMHILGNMVFLWAFGPEIEDAMGRLRYLAFYLLSGLAASLAQIVAMPGSTVPNLGASGAIAGVMGAFLITYPRDRDTRAASVWLVHPHYFYSRGALDRTLVSHSAFQSGRRRGRCTGGWRRLCGSRWRLYLWGGYRANL